MAIKYRQDIVAAGFHGDFMVTPMTMSSGVRALLPTDKLAGRKTVYIWNDGSDGQYLWIGDHSVSEFTATTSGLPINGQSGFSISAGRVDIYGITNETSLSVKVTEAS